MKKRIVLYFTFLFTAVVLLAAGCSRKAGSETTAGPATGASRTAAATAPEIRQPSLEDLAQALEETGIRDWGGDYKKLTFEQRTALEQYFANRRHEDIRFTDEGVMYADARLKKPEKPWGEDDILKAAPEPDFGAVFTSWSGGKSVSMSYTEVAEETISAYIEKVKAAGFDRVTADSVSPCCGRVFEASNAGGVKVSLASKSAGSQPVTTVTVTVP